MFTFLMSPRMNKQYRFYVRYLDVHYCTVEQPINPTYHHVTHTFHATASAPVDSSSVLPLLRFPASPALYLPDPRIQLWGRAAGTRLLSATRLSSYTLQRASISSSAGTLR